MANIQSAKKRIRVTKKKTLQNRMVKSALRTQLKKFDAAVKAEEGSDLVALYNDTVSSVDAAASKGIIHKNKANRTKAQLAKKMTANA
ncbi:MAG: 30S ribosomal protein S20 [Christensenellaceae bacterium]|jgi:small subunit ribosomal protein S20